MNRFRNCVPDGVHDTLPGECYNKRLLERRLMRCFYLAGYEELETPTFEHFEVFASGIGSLRQEQMLKFVDVSGHILVLRPDLTMPIARVAAQRKDSPLRYAYIGNAFGNEGDYYAQQREFTQAGVELLGIASPQADAEVIALAIESLEAAGLDDFQLDLGQVEFFKGLMEENGLSETQSEALHAYVDSKNMLAIELYLGSNGASARVRRSIAALTRLYGGADILDEAEGFSKHPRCRAAVDNLRAVYALLRDMGFEKRISFDLGLLQSLDYYSGIVFKGISSSLGMPILTGGRYDRLLSGFGREMSATGFAMGLKRILIALEKQGMLEEVPAIAYVVSAAENMRREAYAFVRQMRGANARVQTMMHLDRAELEAYARERGAEARFFG